MNKIFAFVFLFSMNLWASSDLLNIKTIYTDLETKKEVLIEGKGFSVGVKDNSGKIRHFVVTAAHVSQGNNLIITTSQRKECLQMDRLAHNEADLEIIEVSNCFDTPHFIYSKGEFISATNPDKFIILGAKNSSISQIDLKRDGRKIPYSAFWYNMAGDLVTNFSVHPGQSGSPLVEKVKSDENGPQYILKGIVKSRWRLFGLSKAASSIEVKNLVFSYIINQKRVHVDPSFFWNFRNNSLAQEIDSQHRDLNFQSNPSGNGISVDTGDPRGTVAWRPESAILEDFNLLKNSNFSLGMIFDAHHILGFRVKLKCNLNDSTTNEVLVYGSMANLSFLRKNQQSFEIYRNIYQYEDLGPYWFQRHKQKNYDDIIRTINTPLPADIADLEVPKQNSPTHSPNAKTVKEVAPKDLINIKKNESQIWGKDSRNMVFLDFEEIPQSFNSPCMAAHEEWQKGFVKEFKMELSSGKASMSVSEY